MRKLAITNMTGARNRGCQALVDSILLGLDESITNDEISVDLYTRDTDFDRHCFGDRVDVLSGSYILQLNPKV